MSRLRRILAPVLAVVTLAGGIWIASASAQTDPQPTAPLGTYCPPIPANAVAGQDIVCKVIADPFWTPPTTSTTPNTTTMSSTTTTVPPVTTTTTAVSTTTTTTTSTPPPASLKGWQLTAQNVGLAPHGLNCDSLPLYLGPAKPLPGNTISGYRIDKPLDLTSGDLLIEKSCLRPTTTGYHNKFLVTTFGCVGNDCDASPNGNVTIRDSEISGAAMTAQNVAYSCAFDGVATLQRNYVHDVGSGICLRETGTQFNALIEHNLVSRLRAYGNPSTTGSHNEAMTVRDFVKNSANTRWARFNNNWFESSGAGGNQSGSAFLQPWLGQIHNVTFDGNYFKGGGWTVYLENHNHVYGNMRATNNRFTHEGYGPCAVSSGVGWASFTLNARLDVTKADSRGLTVNC